MCAWSFEQFRFCIVQVETLNPQSPRPGCILSRGALVKESRSPFQDLGVQDVKDSGFQGFKIQGFRM